MIPRGVLGSVSLKVKGVAEGYLFPHICRKFQLPKDLWRADSTADVEHIGTDIFRGATGYVEKIARDVRKVEAMARLLGFQRQSSPRDRESEVARGRPLVACPEETRAC